MAKKAGNVHIKRKRIRRPGRHAKDPNKRYKPKNYFG